METITIEILDILQIEKRIDREEAIRAGAYDGRHRNRVYKDRKREKSRRHCRSKDPHRIDP